MGLQLGQLRARGRVRLAVADAGVPGLGGALHVGLRDPGRGIDGRQPAGVFLGLGALGGGALSRRPKLLQLGVQLLDPGADLLGGPVGFATGDEIAGCAKRLATIEAQAVEQAVELLP